MKQNKEELLSGISDIGEKLWWDGYNTAKKKYEKQLQIAKSQHFGLTDDDPVSQLCGEKEILNKKLKESKLTCGKLSHMTVKQAMKELHLSTSEALELLGVMAMYNYHFCRDDFPF
ncbi:MAG: hypothetical protein NC218_01550 [Acetobacter sp.]|nr:hypothetical protein [Acetobacter sp.]